jgi:pimeloyl-ACP methyl ester carboxylesterase
MLVFLHPLPFDATVWSDEIRSLGPSIAPNLHDFGDDVGAWADGALAAAGEGPLDVIGNSVGASCALEIAARVPDRVRSIVFIGGNAGHRPEPDFRDEALRVLAHDGIDAAWSRYWEPLFAKREVVAGAHERVRRVGADAVAAGVRAFHSRPDRYEFALSLDIRVLFVTGEFDINPARAERFAKDLRRGSFCVLDGIGHYAPLEDPERLAEVVGAFVS